MRRGEGEKERERERERERRAAMATTALVEEVDGRAWEGMNASSSSEAKEESEADVKNADEEAVLKARAAPLRPRFATKRRGLGKKTNNSSNSSNSQLPVQQGSNNSSPNKGGSFLNKLRARVLTGVLGEKKKIPEYLIFNKHILSGYRVNFTVKDSLLSLFTLHNESINIWTHVAGFLLFLGLLIYLCYAPPIKMIDRGVQARGAAVQAPSMSRDSAMEPLLLLQKARDQLRKTLHLEEVGDHLRKILTDVESAVFRQKHFQPKGHFEQSIRYLKKGLKRRNIGFEEVRGVLLDLETQLVTIITSSFKVEYWPMFVYLVGAMFCMLSSSMAHTFSICSPKANKWWWRIDYVGIAVMITTSFCPIIYYTFLNDLVWRNFYLISILSLGSLVACISLLEIFQSDSYRVFRAGFFVAFAICAVFPLFHAIALYAPLRSRNFTNIILYELLMGALYLGGAFIYAIQFPESKYPGKFDLFFNSHQMFHVMIVFAAYAHYAAVLEAIDWRYGSIAESFM